MKILLSQLFLLIYLNGIVNAKSKPPIPVPKLDAMHVIQIADSSLKSISKDKWMDFNVKEYILLSVNYTDKVQYNERNTKSEWFWVVTFVHPIHNDHTFSFKIDNQNKAILLEASE